MVIVRYLDFDFSRALNTKELKSAQARLLRVRDLLPGSVAHARSSIDHLGGSSNPLLQRGLRVRPGFVYQDAAPAVGDASDRRAPRREDRPPLTRLMSSQGATLRLELAALAIAQMRHRPGSRAVLDLPVGGLGPEKSWSDVIATSAQQTTNKGIYYLERDKRARSVLSSLRALKAANLAAVTRVGAQNVIAFLDEEGASKPGDTRPYVIPRVGDTTVNLPGELISQGWIHVLEDSELAVLLMIACRHGAFVDEHGVAFPGEVRLLNYGISRDTYTKALKTLAWFDLINVYEHERRDDGRALDYAEEGAQLHRLKLHRKGFLQDGPTKVRTVLEEQVVRATGTSTRS